MDFNMRKTLRACLFSLFFLTSVVKAADQPLFAYTHLTPSPFTLPAGRVSMGTTISIGITNFLQLSTDLLRDAYQIFNANLKVSVIRSERFAAAVFVSYENYNLTALSSLNPSVQIESWQPGGVIGLAISDAFAVFATGRYDASQSTSLLTGAAVSGYTHSTSVGLDLSWAYQRNSGNSENPESQSDSPSRLVAMGNVLSLGSTYDFGYEIPGVGISHHWPGFQLGLHYYFKTNSNSVLPIFAGGMSFDI